jgi:hypothetical protein
MRDRLIELLENCEHISYLDSVYDLPNIYDLVADHLLANGVIVPPDHKALFYTAEMMLEQWNETTGAIQPHTSWYYELLSVLEDTVQLSFGAGILYKEEAEQALAERGADND